MLVGSGIHSYDREIVFEDQNCQCIKITWPPDHWAMPHDHGVSQGWFTVLKGRAFQMTYSRSVVFANKNRPLAQRQNPFSPKYIYHVGRGDQELSSMIHVLGNDDPAHELITVHFYQPLLKMRYYPMLTPLFIEAIGRPPHVISK